MIMVFAAEVFSLHWLTAAGLLVVVVSVAAWHWPDEAPSSEEEEEQFEREYGVEVYSGGSPTVTRWAMYMMILLIGIALFTFLFSYWYLRLNAREWPLAGLPLPNLLPAAIAAVLAVASAVCATLAARRICAGNTATMHVFLGLTSLFALAALAAGIWDYANTPFAPSDTAYGSLWWVIGIFAFLVMGAGVVMAFIVQFWGFQGHYSPRRHGAVSNAARYFAAAAAVWLIAFGTLYLTPHLL
jgi:heme/copper-type cytochrome/quinol oxidase subunit 3